MLRKSSNTTSHTPAKTELLPTRNIPLSGARTASGKDAEGIPATAGMLLDGVVLLLVVRHRRAFVISLSQTSRCVGWVAHRLLVSCSVLGVGVKPVLPTYLLTFRNALIPLTLLPSHYSKLLVSKSCRAYVISVDYAAVSLLLIRGRAPCRKYDGWAQPRHPEG